MLILEVQGYKLKSTSKMQTPKNTHAGPCAYFKVPSAFTYATTMSCLPLTTPVASIAVLTDCGRTVGPPVVAGVRAGGADGDSSDGDDGDGDASDDGDGDEGDDGDDCDGDEGDGDAGLSSEDCGLDDCGLGDGEVPESDGELSDEPPSC